jgi:hypothetical protein
MIASSANDDIFFEPILDIKEDAKFIDSKAIDTALPVSQIQDTLLSRHGSVVTRWINKKIVFPGSKSDLSWINTARNAVAAHNPILRTAIYHDRLAGKYVQTVLQSSRSLDARDGAIECTEPPAFSPLLYNQIPHSALQYDDQKSIYILTVWYPHIPLDDFSFVLIEDDLTCFYRGVSFRERAPLRAYLAHAQESYNHEKGISYWRSAYADAIAPQLPYSATRTDGNIDRQAFFIKCDQGVVNGLDFLEKTEHISRVSMLEALWAIIPPLHCAAESVVFASAGRDTCANPDPTNNDAIGCSNKRR